MELSKPVHTLVLDTGAIIKNEPPVSTLLSKNEKLITVPEIIGEIKDAATRSRVQTTLLPFLELRSPRPESVKFVTDFARRTGDLAVLSKADVLIIALGYEVECERNGGDWRLRRAPGQGRVNGAPPSKLIEKESLESEVASTPAAEQQAPPESVQPSELVKSALEGGAQVPANEWDANQTKDEQPTATPPKADGTQGNQPAAGAETGEQRELNSTLANTTISATKEKPSAPKVDSAQDSAESQEDSSDSEGWITPSNLKKKQAQDAGASATQTDEQKTMQVAILTTDFAMQNVILQINLNLLSPSLTRVKHLKTFVLRCHACFQVTKDMSKQFCPKCGQPALTRVSCSTSANGEFKLHLKKNMQWNHRGEKYSVPKPVHGASNGRVKGGGAGGAGETS